MIVKKIKVKLGATRPTARQYESVRVYLLDIEIDEIHERGCSCRDCIDEIIAGVAAMGPEDME